MENSIPEFKTCIKCGSTIIKTRGLKQLRFIDVGRKVYEAWCYICCIRHLDELSDEQRKQFYAYVNGEPTHLRCSKCDEVKSVTLFSRKLSGYQNSCKACNSIYERGRNLAISNERIKKYNESLSQEEIELNKTHKKCVKCSQWVSRNKYSKKKDMIDGLRSWCRSCLAEYGKIYGTPEKNRKRMLKHHYDLTPEQYDEMFQAQGSVCAICKQPETRRSRSGKISSLVVDHHHETFAVRSLLCHKCNVAYGLLEEDESIILSLLEYHRRFNQD